MTEEIRAPNRNARRDSQRLSSVTTAIHLMKSFNEQDVELGISELAKRLKIAKSTVHRLASTLLEEGLLEQNPDNGRYRLGIGLFSLGTLVRGRFDVASEAKVILHELRSQTGENARLAVLGGRSAVYIHDFESPEPVRLRSITGHNRDAHATAEGACILAGMEDSALEDYLLGPLEALTPNTLTDPAALMEKLRRVRRTGYAVEDEEYELGARCIAAPVRRSDGKIIAAIGVAGPRDRIRKRNFAALADVVGMAAQRISERLGYRGRPPTFPNNP